MIAGVVQLLSTPTIPFLALFHSTPVPSTGVCAADRKQCLPANKSLFWDFYLLRDLLAFILGSPATIGDTVILMLITRICSGLVLLFSHFCGFCLRLVVIEEICLPHRANYSKVF